MEILLGVLLLIFLLVLVLSIYFIPTGVAVNRDVGHKGLVFFINLLFGWTLFGWCFCLVIALLGETGPNAKT